MTIEVSFKVICYFYKNSSGEGFMAKFENYD